MNKQKTLWITALFLLLIGLLQLSFAENIQEDRETERALAENIQANLPQTPEKLLQVFKDLLTNPDVDGEEFCEKRLGIDRKIWRMDVLEKSLDKKLLGPFDKYPLAPFEFVEAAINRQDKLGVLVLWFYKNPSFHITPELIREILGETERVGVTSPKADSSRGEYRVSYQYLTKEYHLVVRFRNADEAKQPETRRMFSRHTPEQEQIEQDRRKSFEVHKEYQPTDIELRRIERPEINRH